MIIGLMIILGSTESFPRKVHYSSSIQTHLLSSSSMISLLEMLFSDILDCWDHRRRNQWNSPGLTGNLHILQPFLTTMHLIKKKQSGFVFTSMLFW